MILSRYGTRSYYVVEHLMKYFLVLGAISACHIPGCVWHAEKVGSRENFRFRLK